MKNEKLKSLGVPDGCTDAAVVICYTQKNIESYVPDILKTEHRVVNLTPRESLDISHWLRLRWPAGEQLGCKACGAKCLDVVDHGTSSSVGMNCFAQGYCPGIKRVVVIGDQQPMHPKWVSSLRDQCEKAGAEFMFKGWGDWAPYHNLMYLLRGGVEMPPASKMRWISVNGYIGNKDMRESESDVLMMPVGSKSAGCVLDGKDYALIGD